MMKNPENDFKARSKRERRQYEMKGSNDTASINNSSTNNQAYESYLEKLKAHQTLKNTVVR